MNDLTGRDPSNSAVQIEIEQSMLVTVQLSHPDWRTMDWKEVAKELDLAPVWQGARPDAVWQDNDEVIIIAECYARIETLKTGHRRKLAMDALKLTSLRNAVKDPKRLRCLLIVPEELDRQLQSDNWFSVSIHQAAEVVTVKLSEDQLEKLRRAVELQGAGQARVKRDRGEPEHG